MAAGPTAPTMAARPTHTEHGCHAYAHRAWLLGRCAPNMAAGQSPMSLAELAAGLASTQYRTFARCWGPLIPTQSMAVSPMRTAHGCRVHFLLFAGLPWHFKETVERCMKRIAYLPQLLSFCKCKSLKVKASQAMSVLCAATQ